MCVIILVDNEGERPSIRMLEKAWEANDDGVGLAWREPAEDGEGLEVVWKKGIEDKQEAIRLCQEVPIPYVVHFRAASPAFPVRPALTHPFEITEDASFYLEGRSKHGVLFHNGTWDNWDKFCLDVAARSGAQIPTGPFSDTRGIAWLTAVMGRGFMNFLPQQRGVVFLPDRTEVFSGPGWKRVTDGNGYTFWCSNDRPWPVATQGQMCYAPRCIRKDVDSDGYCSMHKGGELIKEATVTNPTVPFGRDAIKVGPGGAATTQLPFRLIHAPGPLITVAQAEALAKQGKFTKGLAKEVRDCHSRLVNGRKQQRQRALVSLQLATQLLTWCATVATH